jgi:hypothetical protein
VVKLLALDASANLLALGASAHLNATSAQAQYYLQPVSRRGGQPRCTGTSLKRSVSSLRSDRIPDTEVLAQRCDFAQSVSNFAKDQQHLYCGYTALC